MSAASFIEQERAKCTPAYWFLPFDKSALHDRSLRWKQHYGFEQQPYTSNNEVIPYIDGAAYMNALAVDLNRMTAHDKLLMIGWRFKSGIQISQNANLIQTIQSLLQNGVDVRALVHKATIPPIINWDENPFLKSIVLAFFYAHPLENEIFVSDLNQAGGQAILDDQLPRTHEMSSHHQKSIVLSINREFRAYVGGIDLAPDRLDTPDHQRESAEERFTGWHDLQCGIRGDAVRHIWANFAERWNDKVGISAKPEQYTPLEESSAPPPSAQAAGTHHVQVLRTLACDNTFGFAPLGEQTLRHAYEKAIQQAEHYIYIEDQFLYHCEISDLLKRRLSEVSTLHLIIVTAVETDLPPPFNWHHFYLRDQFFENVLDGGELGASSRVHAFGLYQSRAESAPPIYVHSKVLIVDDRYVCVGSGNVNWRSLTTDTELNIGVVDATLVESQLNDTAVPVSKFARDLRLKLWAEHLGMSEAELGQQSLADAIALFPQLPDQQIGHLRPLVRDPGRRLTPESLALQAIPEGLAAFLRSFVEFFSPPVNDQTDPLQSGDAAAQFFLQEIDPVSECEST